MPISGPKSTSSFQAGLRASGNSSTLTTRPTRMSSLSKSSIVATATSRRARARSPSGAARAPSLRTRASRRACSRTARRPPRTTGASAPRPPHDARLHHPVEELLELRVEMPARLVDPPLEVVGLEHADLLVEAVEERDVAGLVRDLRRDEDAHFLVGHRAHHRPELGLDPL